MRVAILAGLAVVWQMSAVHADVELKNDGFNSGDMAAFQGGFATGEIGASRFVAPDAGRTLLKVQLLYGGNNTNAMSTVTLDVFDDSAGTDAPGSKLYFNDFQLADSNTAIQEMPTTDMVVTLPQQFRIGIEFKQGGIPSIARDNDGSIAATKNFIFGIPGGWLKSQTAGLTGDWIIRAFVSGAGGTTGGDGGIPTGGACTSNPDCPTGQFCDTTAGTCTFECRTDPDCGGGICNSLGQCVGGAGGGGGCCQSDRGGGETGALLGAGFLTLVLRRRRCA